jgi:hypothetical protein
MSEFILLGVMMGMTSYARPAHKGSIQNEFLIPG